jgi:hypothetical protein
MTNNTQQAQPGAVLSSAEFDDVPSGYQGAFAEYRADMGVVTVIFGSMPAALAYVDRLRTRWDAKQRRAASSNTEAKGPRSGPA